MALIMIMLTLKMMLIVMVIIKGNGNCNGHANGNDNDLSNKPNFLWLYWRNKTTRDFGRARERLVNHSPDCSWFTSFLTSVMVLLGKMRKLRRVSSLYLYFDVQIVSGFLFRWFFGNLESWLQKFKRNLGALNNSFIPIGGFNKSNIAQISQSYWRAYYFLTHFE